MRSGRSSETSSVVPSGMPISLSAITRGINVLGLVDFPEIALSPFGLMFTANPLSGNKKKLMLSPSPKSSFGMPNIYFLSLRRTQKLVRLGLPDRKLPEPFELSAFEIKIMLSIFTFVPCWFRYFGYKHNFYAIKSHRINGRNVCAFEEKYRIAATLLGGGADTLLLTINSRLIY